MTTATATDWAALHRDLADVYARHGRPDDERAHRRVADVIEEYRAFDAAWETHFGDVLRVVGEVAP